MLSFFTMQGIVVPSIAETEMQAVALKASQARPALISGIFRKSAWEEFDEKAKTIRETNVSYYIEKADGKTTTLTPKGEVDESMLDQYVDYNPLTKSISLSSIVPQESTLDKVDRDDKESPTKRVLVLLSEFENSTPVNITAEQYEQYLFGENGYIKKFYSEMTHGQVEFEADVRGWYHMYAPGSSFTTVSSLDQCGLSAEALNYMADYYNVNISDYDIVVSVSNCEEYETLGGSMYGSYELGIPLIRILGHYDRLDVNEMQNYTDWPGLVWNMVHEIGHTFGLPRHSNSLDCAQETIANNCSEIDYGNPFDAMGHWSGRIFNFLRQREAGWISNDNIMQITESGAYHLDNLQTQDGVVGAQISVPGIPYPIFALEHRKATGFDSGISSGQINSVNNGLLLYSRVEENQTNLWPVSTSDLRWRLVDPHPTSVQMYDDTVADAITLTTPFFNDHFGLAISIIGISNNGIDFLVDYDHENSICGQLILNPSPISNQLCNIPAGYAINNFLLSGDSPSQIDLTWTNTATDATSLTIERATNPNFISNHVILTNSLSPTETSYSNIDLLPQSQYYYFRIRASNSIGNSLWTIYGPINSTNLAPSGLVATAIDQHQIDLSWNDNSENEATFTIEISENSDFSNNSITLAMSNTTSKSFGWVQQNTTYYFRIRANYYMQGAPPFSEWSNTAIATTPPW